MDRGNSSRFHFRLGEVFKLSFHSLRCRVVNWIFMAYESYLLYCVDAGLKISTQPLVQLWYNFSVLDILKLESYVNYILLLVC